MSANEYLRYSAPKGSPKYVNLANRFDIENDSQAIGQLFDGGDAWVRGVDHATTFADGQCKFETEIVHKFSSGKEKNRAASTAEGAVTPTPAVLLRYGPESIKEYLFVHGCFLFSLDSNPFSMALYGSAICDVPSV